MDGLELEQQIEELAEGKSLSRFNQLIAITVAIVAVFMAIAKVKDDNIVQGMQAAQAHEVDMWNQYQAKSLKEVVYERQIEHWKLVMDLGGETGSEKIQKKISQWDADVKRYLNEKNAIKLAAEGARKDYDALNFTDDQFDMCDALLGLAVAMLAMCGLTRNRHLYLFAVVVALFGIVMGFAGFFGLNIHPGFIKYLS